MISLDKLKTVTHLITHGPACPDGIASALIIRDALPYVRVTFMQHGTKEHRELEIGPGVLFCDFTPWCSDELAVGGREFLLNRWLDAGALVLDHHPTELVRVFEERGQGVFGENDKAECGAWLAYEHVWRPLHSSYNDLVGYGFERTATQVRDFAQLAAIRDTWKSDDPRFEEASRQASMLVFLPRRLRSEMKLSDALAFCQDEKLAAIIRERQIDAARGGLDESHRFTTAKGTRVLMFQGVSTTSDAAELADRNQKDLEQIAYTDEMLEEVASYPDIVAGFHYRVDAGKLQLQFSTRSHTGYDVGALAKSRGGGGHKAAAGFTVEVSPEVSVNPYRLFQILLEEYEGA